MTCNIHLIFGVTHLEIFAMKPFKVPLGYEKPRKRIHLESLLSLTHD